MVQRLREAGCVYAEAEADVLIAEAHSPHELQTMVQRRVAGLPLEHLVGWVSFCGRRIVVEPGVFIPRPRTELLARCARDHLHEGATVVDLCCGSGAVAAVLAGNTPLDLYAVDIDPVAVACARKNLNPLGGRVLLGDLFAPLPDGLRGRIEVLTANVPYIPSSAIAFLPAEARLHEPRVALDGGVDGLDVLRRLAADARAWLAPKGHVLVETSEAQSNEAVGILQDAGLAAHVERDDEIDATVVIGSPAS